MMAQNNHDLSDHGLEPQGDVYWNLPPASLIEEAVRRKEGVLTAQGPFNAITAPHTGRSPRDRFVVQEPGSENDIWWGDVNVPITEEAFEQLYRQCVTYLNSRGSLFVRDVFAGASRPHRLAVRVVNEQAWHNLFVHNMFLRPSTGELAGMAPDFTLLHAPGLKIENYAELGLNSNTAVALHLGKRMILVAGTSYAGEMKKSIFSVMNYLLPKKNVLSMHCSANVGPDGDSALFFGLSGTGKTTLSADPQRGLVGDDEHGWNETGIFNFEGGCYAKVIQLSEEAEPAIYDTTRRFGTILENVMVVDETRTLDLDSDVITENTRGSYPIDFIPNCVRSGQAGHPRHIFFLTADAFGVMPPIARLTTEQAMYHFLSGYTAKVAGTERGVTEPQATFSACFGSPFLTLPPGVYARLLGEKLQTHQSQVWLINTGWTGGAYGDGLRMKIDHTRAMLQAALNGRLDDVEYVEDPVFALRVPKHVPGVPDEVLLPRRTWKDPEAYDRQARKLAQMFSENFYKLSEVFQAEDARYFERLREAGPRVDATV